MVSTTQVIGGPGTGKTTHLMSVVESLGDEGVMPHEIGFSSFTRSAITSAAQAASRKFCLEADTLTQQGWFKTLHSVCYHMLDINSKQLLTDNRESLQWLENTFGEPVSPACFDSETGMPAFGGGNDVGSILAWWSTCRNSLKTVGEMMHCSPFSQHPIQSIVEKIKRYERRKRMDGRLDFADLPLMVAGIRHDIDTIRQVTPLGRPPDVQAWILDEYQDTFPAIHAAARRIVSHKSVKHVYVSGDNFQAIYGFSGSHPRFLLSGWEYDHRHALRQSHRCPPPVMELAEDTIRLCSDYYDRQIIPREDSSGGVYSMLLKHDGPMRKLDKSWMIIARTNSQAARMGQWLSRADVPWCGTGGGAYLSHRLRVVARALLDLHDGRSINCYEWLTLARGLQNFVAGNPLLTDSFRFMLKQSDIPGINEQVSLANVTRNGGTEHLVNLLASSSWPIAVSQSNSVMKFTRAAEAYGIQAATDPKIKVGTIHSVKGGEADTVLLYDGVTTQCRENMRSPRRAISDEEYRVWYVGVTRAKKRLIVARFDRDYEPMYSGAVVP